MNLIFAINQLEIEIRLLSGSFKSFDNYTNRLKIFYEVYVILVRILVNKYD
jgi:hypothetical protein